MSTNGLGHVGCRKQVTEALGKEGVVVRKANTDTHTEKYTHKKAKHILYRQCVQFAFQNWTQKSNC